MLLDQFCKRTVVRFARLDAYCGLESISFGRSFADWEGRAGQLLVGVLG